MCRKFNFLYSVQPGFNYPLEQIQSTLSKGDKTVSDID